MGYMEVDRTLEGDISYTFFKSNGELLLIVTADNKPRTEEEILTLVNDLERSIWCNKMRKIYSPEELML